MTVRSADIPITGADILGKTSLVPDASAILESWRQKVKRIPAFAVLPALLAWQQSEVRAEYPILHEPVAPGRDTPLRHRRTAICNKPDLLRRASGAYLLPRQRNRMDIVAQFTATDDCPGSPIPAGTYTAADPYVDTGDTTGAASTVSFAAPCFSLHPYSYSYFMNGGPDKIYSFTITDRGPNPRLQVTTSSPTYDPQVYILNGVGGFGCPTGEHRYAFNCVSAVDQGGPGDSETLTLSTAPLNVPLHLFIDSIVFPGAGGYGPYTLRVQDVTIAPAPVVQTAPFDFDGDGKTDIAVYRSSNGTWYILASTSGPTGFQWGAASDKLVPGHYDPDGRSDLGVFRPSQGLWYLWRTQPWVSGPAYAWWGDVNDIAVAGNFDSDLAFEPTVFRPLDGTWRIVEFNGAPATIPFGRNGDIPVVGDYDGDRVSDIAVFRPAEGIWYIRRSNGSGDMGYQFGLATDKLVPADYDRDGKTDIAVYRPSEGRWYIANSGGNPAHTIKQFGAANDIPVPGDYDGDGFADIAIFRPADGTWWINRSTAGLVVIQWGQNGDRPIPAAFNDR